jgi:hypothetical protein
MVKPDVVAYLQANLKKHPIDALRRQLADDGVGDVDFDDSLKAVMNAPVTAPAAPHGGPSHASVAFLVIGVALVAGIAVLITLRREPAAPPPSSTVVSATGESAFVGHTGYVIRLPKGYEAAAAFKDSEKTVEVVHFCRAGTDPTNFLHEGLFGQLGIVRLEVRPNPFSGNITAIERLTSLVTADLTQRGCKFSPPKVIPISSLRGVRVQIELPEPSIETYILGEEVLYHFYAGQDDEVYHDIVNSLRDPHAETL